MRMVRYQDYDERKMHHEAHEHDGGWLGYVAMWVGLVIYALVVGGLAVMAIR